MGMRSLKWLFGALPLVFGMCSCGGTGQALQPTAPSSVKGSSISYRTPSASGFHCVQEGWIHDFFTFSIADGIVTGHVVQSNVSTRAELPMNGSETGRKITLIPLSGFGVYQGTLSGDSLRISSMTEGAPEPLQCSLTTDTDWNASISTVPPNASRQLSTADFLAQFDLEYTGNAGQVDGTGPFVTPLTKLVRPIETKRYERLGPQRPTGTVLLTRLPSRISPTEQDPCLI